MVHVQAVPPSISEGVQWYLIRFLEIRRDIDLPCLATYLAAGQSGQIDFFLFMRIGLKEVGGCPSVMERAHIVACEERT